LATFEAFNRQKACRHGQMLYNANDTYIGRSLDLYGEFSEGEVEVFRQVIQPGYVVVEVGANIGAHTVFLAQQVGDNGSVIAFEPQRVVFQTLCANIALNSLPNVLALQQAVGAEPGSIKVPTFDYRHAGNFGGLALGSFQVGEDVPVITLDSLNLQRCHFIKVDVEGMERDVLRGAVRTVEQFKPILYIENDRAEKSAALVNQIDAMGYNMYWHLPFYFRANNFLGNTNNVFPNTVSVNMVCVHKSLPQNLQNFEQVDLNKPTLPMMAPVKSGPSAAKSN
jgi:FkbM family methyltransferase